MKFSHDRVTVKRFGIFGREFSDFFNPKSAIRRLRSEAGKPAADVIAAKMFRAKASQADMVIFAALCFPCRFGEENRAF